MADRKTGARNGKPKRKMAQRRSAMASQQKKPLGMKELVVTLSVASGDVVKIEQLEKTGRRKQISEADFAALAGDDEMGDLRGVVEDAYAAGVSDAIHDDLADERVDDDGNAIHASAIGGVMGRQLLRHWAHQIVLRRVLRRELSQPRRTTEQRSHH